MPKTIPNGKDIVKQKSIPRTDQGTNHESQVTGGKRHICRLWTGGGQLHGRWGEAAGDFVGSCAANDTVPSALGCAMLSNRGSLAKAATAAWLRAWRTPALLRFSADLSSSSIQRCISRGKNT